MDLQALPQRGAPRRLQVSYLRWGAVAGGVVVGLSLYLLLVLFGAAIGLLGLRPQLMPGGESVVGGVWLLLSATVATGVAGYVTGRLAGMARRADGLLHGAVTWGVSTLLLLGLSAALGPVEGVLPSGRAWWLFLTLLLSLSAALASAVAGVNRVADRGTDESDERRRLRA